MRIHQHLFMQYKPMIYMKICQLSTNMTHPYLLLLI